VRRNECYSFRKRRLYWKGAIFRVGIEHVRSNRSRRRQSLGLCCTCTARAKRRRRRGGVGGGRKRGAQSSTATGRETERDASDATVFHVKWRTNATLMPVIHRMLMLPFQKFVKGRDTPERRDFILSPRRDNFIIPDESHRQSPALPF